MRVFVLVLGALLLAAPLSAAEAPLLHCQAIPGEESAVFALNLELWIQAAGSWQLTAAGSSGLAFRGHGGELAAAGCLFAGSGPYAGELGVEVHCQLPPAAGSYLWELQLELTDAHGVALLRLPEAAWIVPLNTGEVAVQRGEQMRVLSDGEWFLLTDEDQVYCGGQLVLPTVPVVQAAALPEESGGAGTPLAWLGRGPRLEAGDETAVALQLQGPAPPSTLLVWGSAELQLSPFWTLDGEEVAAEHSKEGLRLHLPALPPGYHELRGTVQAGLPWVEKVSFLRAAWQGVEAVLELEIGRGWFARGDLQVIAVQGESGPLLLPQGRLGRVDGPAAVSSSKLDLLLPLRNPWRPIWTGLPLSATMEWIVDVPEKEFSSFLVPILLWDEGLELRLAAGGDHWLFYGDRESLRLQWGKVRVEGTPGEVSASFSAGEEARAGRWQWKRTPRGYEGTWQEGPWKWAFVLPSKDGAAPALSVDYRAEQWRLQLRPGDVRLEYAGDEWAWGSSWPARSWWLQRRDGTFRLHLRPERLRIRFGPGEDTLLRLEVVPGKVQLAVEIPPWEGYLASAGGGLELGMRFRSAHIKGRWHLLSRGACQLKNGLFLLEAGQTVGYTLTSWCTLYAEGAVGLTPSLSARAGLGVILTPRPELVVAAGWDSQRGLHWKAGLVVPFVGRETTELCE